ncbi:response regulator transcription factor [Kibdelosporangium phytohabitans]|uniref:HTH luxR-type domain-containing protein n=1 Tax=Kibdelosporangium phytohabitans TaxID=860235 RepID=A0A0N7F3I6_9PSEU|nr:helix-turn-helix transcriptional regulator [Kibdelosporangium phytohabitans]ALG08735.1 hypothetical protein AOZ06_19045 [Kibdelosporangium phytohabitans]MBE1470150.1 DNA-binding CsgD family transcriptional regulator [Kibdelosporangium phytohabitans]
MELVEREPEPSGGQPRRGALSFAERRVADLAAAGHRNREISLKLHITVSTVEQHLTRIYRKLRIPNRAALRALFRKEAQL